MRRVEQAGQVAALLRRHLRGTGEGKHHSAMSQLLPTVNVHVLFASALAMSAKRAYVYR